MLSESIQALFSNCVHEADPIGVLLSEGPHRFEYSKVIKDICESVKLTDSADEIHEKVWYLFHKWYCVYKDDSGKFVIGVDCICGGKASYRGLSKKLHTIISGQPNEVEECPDRHCCGLIVKEGEFC